MSEPTSGPNTKMPSLQNATDMFLSMKAMFDLVAVEHDALKAENAAVVQENEELKQVITSLKAKSGATVQGEDHKAKQEVLTARQVQDMLNGMVVSLTARINTASERINTASECAIQNAIEASNFRLHMKLDKGLNDLEGQIANVESVVAAINGRVVAVISCVSSLEKVVTKGFATK